jgi:FeS assembly SUF system regulator
MLRIGKLTDYAFVVLVDINRLGSESPRSAQAISVSTGLPLPTVSKVLQRLARNGVIEARRGFCGGYLLGLAASRISAAMVIEAMEGPLALTECSDPASTSCSNMDNCGLHGHWPMINSAVRDALTQVNLETMSRGPEELYVDQLVG